MTKPCTFVPGGLTNPSGLVPQKPMISQPWVPRRRGRGAWPCRACTAARSRPLFALIAHRVFVKSLKSIPVSIRQLVLYISNKMTDLCGNRLLKNVCVNTVCEMKAHLVEEGAVRGRAARVWLRAEVAHQHKQEPVLRSCLRSGVYRGTLFIKTASP